MSSTNELGIPENATLRELWINCGKCSSRHGPYWYAEWKEKGKVVTKYLGKRPPNVSDGEEEQA